MLRHLAQRAASARPDNFVGLSACVHPPTAATSLLLLRRKADEAGDENFVTRLWKGLRGDSAASDGATPGGSAASSERGASGSVGGSGGSSGGGGASSAVVPFSVEQRYREVLAVELPRRPLFPGGIMPVTVTNEAALKELIELKRAGGQAYVGAFLRKDISQAAYPPADAAAAAGEKLGDGEAAAGEALSADGMADRLHEIGTFAQVHNIFPNENGAQLLLVGQRRLKRTRVLSSDPLRFGVQHLKDYKYAGNDDILRATVMEIVSTLKELLHMHPLYSEQLKSFAQFGGNFDDASRLADIAASVTSAGDGALQALLEELNVPERCSEALVLLKKEVELCRLQVDIGKRVEEKISKDQRRYMLMEQLKSIKKELGLEKDDKSALVQKFREKLEPLGDAVPEGARKTIEEELEKLSSLEPSSSEFNVTRNYLEWLTALPWGKYSDESLDIHLAKQVLDEDHYGLDDVKERILEFIAVGTLRGGSQGKIVCLVGPPGVGKTSIGKSIARALGRTYFRFSVGGLSDVAEIKGHRRTYVGAMPGKMVQCLKTAGTSNPLVLIDEIDKLGRGYQGDPASALLELLDPEQNSAFLDHYLDVPVDLSKVLFMCTANVLDTIPPPLLDRMEVIRLSGYIFDEKVSIARKYLEPQALKEAGVPPGAASVADDAMAALIDAYCREAGVRNLKKQLDKMYRKVALQLVRAGVDVHKLAGRQLQQGPLDYEHTRPGDVPAQHAGAAHGDADGARASGAGGGGGEGGAATSEGGSEEGSSSDAAAAEVDVKAVLAEAGVEPVVIGEGALKEYVGTPPFASDKIYKQTPTGVVMGLAWTSMGGSALYIEAAVVPGEAKGGLKLTGQLGDVMKESATIAHTYARQAFEARRPDDTFFKDTTLHVHVPAGATPKDGPSAGCTLITALLSLALARPVKPDLAMTGEVTLTGRVLPIGGVKEKLLAARRADIKHVIFPEGNRADYEELSDAVKEGISAHFVESYEQVFELALGEQDEGGESRG